MKTVAPEGRINDCWNRIGVRGNSSCSELVEHIHCRNCPVFTHAAVDLLDRSMPEEYRREQTALAATPQAKTEEGGENALIFRLQEEWLALPAKVCQEVLMPVPVHIIPFRKTGFVLGLVNVHGELVISVSLEHVIGIPTVSRGASSGSRRVVVIQKNNDRFAFPASEVSGIRRVTPSSMRPVPATVAGCEAHYVTSLFSEDSKDVGLLDEELLFYTLGKGLT